MMLIPISTSGTISIITAPFRTSPVVSAWDVYNSGSGHYRFDAYPFFHTKSGIGGFAATVSLPKCHGGCNQYEYLDGYVSFDLPIPAVANATNVTTNWSIRFSTAWSIAPVSCRYSAAYWFFCGQDAGVSFQARIDLKDLSAGYYATLQSGSFPGFYNSSFNRTSCYGNSCYSYGTAPNGSYSLNASSILGFNIRPMSPHQKYELIVSFSWSVFADSAAYKTSMQAGPATAVLDMARHGNGLALVSIAYS